MPDNFFIPILIYFFIPLLVLALYIKLIDEMKQEGVNDLPVFTLFISLLMYTMPVLFALDSLLSNWSFTFTGLALIAVTGPIIMFLNAVTIYNKRIDTTYHWWIYTASVAYIMYLLLLAVLTLTIIAILDVL